jgi:hypothetical protein
MMRFRTAGGKRVSRKCSIKLEARRRLVGTDAAFLDVRGIVIFSLDGTSGHTAQHGDLADVGECIRNGTLKKLFRRAPKGLM